MHVAWQTLVPSMTIREYDWIQLNAIMMFKHDF